MHFISIVACGNSSTLEIVANCVAKQCQKNRTLGNHFEHRRKMMDRILCIRKLIDLFAFRDQWQRHLLSSRECEVEDVH